MKKLKFISCVLFNIFVMIFALLILFTLVLDNIPIVKDKIDLFFGGNTQEAIGESENVPYKTWYNSIDDVLNGSGAVAAAAEAEGAVLLENGMRYDGATPSLPLDPETDIVSLYSVTAYDYMNSQLGAGANFVNEERRQELRDVLEGDGISVNEELADWYEDNLDTYKRQQNGVRNFKINDAPWDSIPESAKNASGSGTAIFMVGRMSNEDADMPGYDNSKGGDLSELTDGDYLKFTTKELTVINALKSKRESGEIENLILLVNQAVPMLEKDFAEEYGFDSVVWIGYPGSDGLAAVGDLLTGKSNFSGRLSDIWYATKTDVPSWNNFSGDGYDVYQEGIYTGYRYAETRYEDYVMNTGNAGTYIYDEHVNYPFGYGLSYSVFDYGTPVFEKKTRKVDAVVDGRLAEDYADEEYWEVTVEITNNSSSAYSGKEVVQVYLQQPYDEENIRDGVEKPSVELVGFAKTDKLAPGESQSVTVEVDSEKMFAAYNANKVNDDGTEGGYVLDEGSYYLTVAKDSHDAVNNILAVKGYALGGGRMDAEGNADMVHEIDISAGESADYVYRTHGGSTPVNLFDASDPNRYKGENETVTYMSRSNWEGTVKEERTTFTIDSTVNSSPNSGQNYSEFYDESVEYPTYDRVLDDKLTLFDMIGVEYDPRFGASEEDVEKWNDFMDQLSWDDTVTVLGDGLRRTRAVASVGKPLTNDWNATNGLNFKFNGFYPGGSDGAYIKDTGFAARMNESEESKDRIPTGYPCPGIIASTFNIELSYACGQAIGEDALWAGCNGLYGFGLNAHRNPYQGRTGEYSSEDPYLAGVMVGWQSKGAQSKGLYVYNKHFVLNEVERGRVGRDNWLNEQTFRQIYLRGFELAIEIGDAMNVMTSFSDIGNCWTGAYTNLMTGWLRGEAGMKGFAITDWHDGTYRMNMIWGVMAGQDLPDGSDGIGIYEDKGPGSGYGAVAWKMRESAQRIMYVVANSSAMNFVGANTVFRIIQNPWYYVYIALTVTFGALTGISALLSVFAFVRDKMRGKDGNDSAALPQ